MNRHLVFIGPERPQNPKIGDRLNLFAFEGITGEAHHFEITIDHCEALPTIILCKGDTQHPDDGRHYKAHLTLDPRNHAADTIVLHPA